MCNCIEETRKRLIEKIPAMDGSYSGMEIDNIEFSGEYMPDNSKEWELSTHVIISHKPIGKKIKSEMNISFRYCPFCGKRYVESEVGSKWRKHR